VVHASGSPASLFVVTYQNVGEVKEELLRSDDGGSTFYRIPLPGPGRLMVHGATADKLAVVTQAGSKGYAAGMFKFDPRLSGGFPWIKISPEGIAKLGPGCEQLVGETATTEVKPYPVFAMGYPRCTDDYPLARYAGRL
jgi:hypothetical protein